MNGTNGLLAIALALLLAAACRDAVTDAPPPVIGPALDEPEEIDAAAYLPLESGRRWTYEFWDDANGTATVETKRHGWDVRTLDGRDDVRFLFTYGDVVDGPQDGTKSVFAAPPDGPRLFYRDGWTWRMGYDPPIVLLPPDAAVGTTWAWQGALDIAEGDFTSSAELVVVGIESVTVPAGTFRAVRVEETHDVNDLRVTRWYAPGVGLVREDHSVAALVAAEVYQDGKRVEGAAGAVITRRRGARLVAHSAPE